jgi:hypothetical protein
MIAEVTAGHYVDDQIQVFSILEGEMHVHQKPIVYFISSMRFKDYTTMTPKLTDG